MKTIYEIRRANLRQLVKDWNGPANLAAKLGYKTASFLVQMTGPRPVREVSERTARQVEARLGLPPGWLDQQASSAPSGAPRQKLDERLLARVMQAISAVLEDSAATLRSDQLSSVTVLAYEHAALAGTIDEDYIKRLVELCRR